MVPNRRLVLPPELWLHVLNLTPETLRLEDRISQRSPPFSKHTELAIKDHILRSLSISQVCHAWRRIALPKVFRYIVLHDPEQLAAFLSTLRESESKSPYGGSGYGYGRWITHLMLKFRMSLDRQREAGIVHGITEVLRLAPNIQVFCPSYSTDAMELPYETWNALVQNHTPFALRTLQIMGPINSLQLKIAVSRAPALTTLAWGCPHDPEEIRLSLSFSKLQNLHIDFHRRVSLGVFTRSSMPNLRNLAMIFRSERKVPSFFSFLATHGHKLTSLELRIESYMDEPTELSSILRYCPNVTRLAVHVAWFTRRTLPDNLDLSCNPHLQRIILLGLPHYPEPSFTCRIGALMRCVVPAFPYLTPATISLIIALDKGRRYGTRSCI